MGNRLKVSPYELITGFFTRLNYKLPSQIGTRIDIPPTVDSRAARPYKIRPQDTYTYKHIVSLTILYAERVGVQGALRHKFSGPLRFW